jgi:hypothetical protein
VCRQIAGEVRFAQDWYFPPGEDPVPAEDRPPPQLAKDALSMVRLAIRQAKGLPPPGHRRGKPNQAAIEG